MKVRLLRDARIAHKAGEIVEVSPETFAFLFSVGSAEQVSAAPVETAVNVPVAGTPDKRAARAKKK